MITRSFQRFFAQESAGGIVLAIAALAALIVSNSAWGDWYLNQFLMMRGDVIIGESLALSKPLLVWVNDLWMAVFFFLVGLEIKREFVEGELSGKGQLRLPAIAALGGMVVPALIYAPSTQGTPMHSKAGQSLQPQTSPLPWAFCCCSANACQRHSKCFSLLWPSLMTSARL